MDTNLDIQLYNYIAWTFSPDSMEKLT